MARYLFEQEELTAESLEQELGLTPGDIELIIYPTGAVEIETKSVLLSFAQEDKVKAALARRNLPRGKKPKA